MRVPFSASQSPKMAIRSRQVPFATLKPWDLLCRAIQPTPDEVAAMISDLRAHFDGDWRPVVLATGTPRRCLSAWIYGEKAPSPTSRRAVWLVWCLIVRPGSLQTIFDLSTSGRFTDRDRANPATAGQVHRSKRGKRRPPGSVPDPDD